MPASLINARAPWIYSKGDSHLAGFLINSAAAEIMCAYANDGSTSECRLAYVAAYGLESMRSPQVLLV